jgi:hypothetical protein
MIKAQLYAEQMEGFESDDWRHALWSGLLLEHLSRAALANVNPVLLADTTDRSWSHIYFALGFSPLDPKYAPRSIVTNEVVRRLGEILPNFKEMANFVNTHTGRRNAELHSGEAPFEGVDGANWQPSFYRACQILLVSVGLDLEDLFGAEPSKTARALMAAAADDAAKAVLGDIAAHSKVWTTLPGEEREKQRAIADVWATRFDGHRVECPACGSTALVFGDPCAAPHKTIEGDEITETQEYLPSRFECVACRLRITGLAQLIAAKLGARYKRTSTYDAADFYAPEDEHAGYEDDNNEY